MQRAENPIPYSASSYWTTTYSCRYDSVFQNAGEGAVEGEKAEEGAPAREIRAT